MVTCSVGAEALIVEAPWVGILPEAVLEGLTKGGAVFEGGNLEGVFDHVDVFTGHKQNEETNNGEDAGTVYIRTQTSAKAADEGHVKAGAG